MGLVSLSRDKPTPRSRRRTSMFPSPGVQRPGPNKPERSRRCVSATADSCGQQPWKCCGPITRARSAADLSDTTRPRTRRMPPISAWRQRRSRRTRCSRLDAREGGVEAPSLPRSAVRGRDDRLPRPIPRDGPTSRASGKCRSRPRPIATRCQVSPSDTTQAEGCPGIREVPFLPRSTLAIGSACGRCRLRRSVVAWRRSTARPTKIAAERSTSP